MKIGCLPFCVVLSPSMSAEVKTRGNWTRNWIRNITDNQIGIVFLSKKKKKKRNVVTAVLRQTVRLWCVGPERDVDGHNRNEKKTKKQRPWASNTSSSHRYEVATMSLACLELFQSTNWTNKVVKQKNKKTKDHPSRLKRKNKPKMRTTVSWFCLSAHQHLHRLFNTET